jgi:hypothetical protein
VAFSDSTAISSSAILRRKSGILDQRSAVVGPLERGDLLDLAQHVHQAGRVGVAALEFQQVLGVGPALVLLADAVGDRHADIVEEDLVDLLLALGRTVQGRQRLDLDARQGHRQQQER